MKKLSAIFAIASLIAFASCVVKSLEEHAASDSIAAVAKGVGFWTNGLDEFDSASIIGKPIRIGNLEVAQNDFPNQMNWAFAQKACASLGPGWRLPTKDELNRLYQNQDKIGGFASGWNSYFWSSTENDSSAWVQNFGGGYQGKGYARKGQAGGYVRAVRAF